MINTQINTQESYSQQEQQQKQQMQKDENDPFDDSSNNIYNVNIEDDKHAKSQDHPIIFIIGSTASGKTKLSLEICQNRQETSHTFEIVNADSMQIYKTADILTAKATLNEQQMIKHHLLDIIELEKKDFNRKDYFDIASKMIDKLIDRGVVPVVVGGTNYYIESLLFTDYVEDNEGVCKDNDEGFGKDNENSCKNNEGLYKDNETLFKDNEGLYKNKEGFCKDNESLCKDNEGLFKDNENLCKDNESLCKDNEALYNDNRNLYINNENDNDHQLDNEPTQNQNFESKNTFLDESKVNPKDENNHLKLRIDPNWMSFDGAAKYSLLKQIDPIIAERLHANDTRRIENYIKIFTDEYILPSKKLLRVNENRNLRYINPLILWVKFSNKEALMKKISDRVHEMLDMNGILEIISIYHRLEDNGPFNFSKGILQSIGYKEFYEFYLCIKEECKSNIISHGSDNKQSINPIEYVKIKNNINEFSLNTQKIFSQCLEKLIIRTQRYAKKQVTWIQNRLYNDYSLVKNRIFLLEFDNIEEFNEKVVKRANMIIQDYLTGNMKSLLDKADKSKVLDAMNQKLLNWKKYYCETCEYYLNGDIEWKNHKNTKKHHKNKHKKMKLQENIDNMIKYKGFIVNKE